MRRAVVFVGVTALVFVVLLGGAMAISGTPGSPLSQPVVARPVPAPTPVPTPIPSCTTADGKRVTDILSRYAQEWDDTVRLAGSTPRINLAGPVGQLQKTRRDVQAQEWPECGRRAQGVLIRAMDAKIDAFTAFMG